MRLVLLSLFKNPFVELVILGRDGEHPRNVLAPPPAIYVCSLEAWLDSFGGFFFGGRSLQKSREDREEQGAHQRATLLGGMLRLSACLPVSSCGAT